MGVLAVCSCLLLYLALSESTSREFVFERFVSRNPKILGYYPFIIAPYKIGTVVEGPCKTNANLAGTCMTKTKCNTNGGQPYGPCGGNKRGVCCINDRSCGDATSARVTYFFNPGYVEAYTGGGQCQLTINRQNSNVCQLKIEFLTLELAPPSYEINDYGKCTTDFLSLSDPRLPTMCGSNSGQHVYIDFNPGSSFHTIQIDTDETVSDIERKWNLKITQISCNSTEVAPSGCLMYYNDTSNLVSSFNYDVQAPTSDDDLNWTRQINNLHYGICVKPAPGYCSITWKAESSDSFSVSNNNGTTDCQDTYVLIPTTPVADQDIPDRYCGQTFPTDGINTQLTPFVLYVVTNLNSDADSHTRGFQMRYRQISCT